PRSKRRRPAFGSRLVEAREAKGLTQAQAAAAVGITQGTLSELEIIGKGTSYVVHLAKLYGCDPYWLAMKEGVPYPPMTKFSAQAAELAVAFDLMPDRTQAEQELKRRLYLSIQQMLVGASQAIAQTLLPDASPTRARVPSR